MFFFSFLKFFCVRLGIKYILFGEIVECILCKNGFFIRKNVLEKGDFVLYINGGKCEKTIKKIIRKKKDILFNMVVSIFFRKVENYYIFF